LPGLLFVRAGVTANFRHCASFDLIAFGRVRDGAHFTDHEGREHNAAKVPTIE
jgi:hypothetical protein